MNLQLPSTWAWFSQKIHCLNRVLGYIPEAWISRTDEPIFPQLKDFPIPSNDTDRNPTQLTWSLCWVASKGFGHRRQKFTKTNVVGQFSRCGCCFFRGGEGGSWIKVTERGGLSTQNGVRVVFFPDDLVESLLFLVVILPQLPFDKEAQVAQLFFGATQLRTFPNLAKC